MILQFAHTLQEQTVNQLWWKCRRAKSKQKAKAWEAGTAWEVRLLQPPSMMQVTNYLNISFWFPVCACPQHHWWTHWRPEESSLWHSLLFLHSHISLPSLSIRGWSDHLPAHFPHIHLSLPWYGVFDSDEVASWGTRLGLLMYRPLVWCLWFGVSAMSHRWRTWFWGCGPKPQCHKFLLLTGDHLTRQHCWAMCDTWGWKRRGSRVVFLPFLSNGFGHISKCSSHWMFSWPFMVLITPRWGSHVGHFLQDFS